MHSHYRAFATDRTHCHWSCYFVSPSDRQKNPNVCFGAIHSLAGLAEFKSIKKLFMRQQLGHSGQPRYFFTKNGLPQTTSIPPENGGG
jgi:hypothetical protein